ARLFQREARAIATLEHPNILPLYDFGEESYDGTTMTFMVMPFCAEGSLAGWVRQRASDATLSPQDIAYVVEQAAEALQYAHDHHVIHLDVKPPNFLLRSNRKNPNRPTLLLADFGIARNSATAASSSRTIRGTPTSMAPEQWSSTPVAATDQYALAVMAYEMLAGRPPFVGSMEQLMYQHFSVEPPPPSTYNTQLPKAVDAVLLRALAKKPEERFPSIVAFASALEQAVQLAPAELVVGPRPSSIGDSTRDMRTTLAISKAEAHSGTSRMITLPGGQHLNVTVPAGVSDGQIIHLQDLGDSSSTMGELFLTIAITAPEEVHQTSGTVSTEETVLTSGSSIQRPFHSATGHDLPTVASSNPNLQAPERQPQASLPQRRSASRSRSVSIISGLIVLLVLVLVASSFYLYSSHQVNVNALTLSQTATAFVPHPTPVHTPTAAVTPTPKPQNGLYIAGTYKGSMFSEITQKTVFFTMFIGQNKGNAALSGIYTSGSPQKEYSLKGTVDTKGTFSITVQQSAGQTPLYFYGAVQGDYLKGNFCNSSTNACSASTGFFQAGPRY
ncbi:MAG TPA: hypothetical protein DCS90_02765, partial [Ktedonobacter sp.]|nr:hypothetical protein [Ktedonobacter sp.]